MRVPRRVVSTCASAIVSASFLVGAQQAAHAQAAQVNSMIPPQFLDLGKDLADKGIYLSLSYVGIAQWNVGGGEKKGGIFAGELALGGVLDLQKIAGIPGGSLHIIFDERSGNSISGWAGTNFGLTENHGPNNVIRLSELYYEQAIDHDRIDIKFGRTNPTLDFATSAISCSTLNNIFCAQPGIWYTVNNSQAYPVSTWGGRANFQVTPDVYVRVGGYEEDPSQFEGQGFSWAWNRGVGAFIPVEVGYETKTAKYDIGGYYDSGPWTFQPSPTSAKKDMWAWYAQGQQVIWSPGGSSPQALTLFGGAMVQAHGGAPYWGEYYAGLYDTAPFVSRPNDTAMIVGAYTPLNRGASPYSSQYIFEVNYGFTVIPGVVLKPAVDYVIHPDQIGFTNPRKVNNAWIVGAEFFVDLGQILKFPQFVPH